MRYDHSVRALKTLLDRGALGAPVLATIDMRAIPHWMPWARGGRSLATFIMSIHHLDTFRYWLGDPLRVLASTRPDPRTKFPHADGINLYILEYEEARASAWDDVWGGPVREGAAAEIGIGWRFEGTHGLALGTIGWPGWPERVPSTHRLLDDRRPGDLAPPPMARGLVPRRLLRHHGRPAPRPRIGDRARHLGPRQPAHHRPLRGRAQKRPRASRGDARRSDERVKQLRCVPRTRPIGSLP